MDDLFKDILNLVKKYVELNNQEIVNAYANFPDYIDGKGNKIGMVIDCKLYLRDLQPKAEGPISIVED